MIKPRWNTTLVAIHNVIAPRRDKAPQEISWLRADNRLVRVEEPSTPSDLPDLVPTSSLGSRTEIENFLIQAKLSVSASTLVDNMGTTSVPMLDIEKMIEKIVAASLEKLLRSDKGKEQVIIEDDEAKKMPTKKTESKPVVSKKFEKMDKKLEKLHVFMKSKGMDQYVDIDDDSDEELELKRVTRLTYKMPKVAKYDGTGDPKDDNDEKWLNQSKEVWVGSEDEMAVNPVTLDVPRSLLSLKMLTNAQKAGIGYCGCRRGLAATNYLAAFVPGAYAIFVQTQLLVHIPPPSEFDPFAEHGKLIRRGSDSEAPDMAVVVGRLEHGLGASFSFILERTGQAAQGMLQTHLVSPYRMSSPGCTHRVSMAPPVGRGWGLHMAGALVMGWTPVDYH
ncbi:hypothetical protein JCGZ_25713 [Jatropha curcas]|uniref:Uncharacterized protein n=1 Tax=Jatropha curcas TaxID=180498 RepID=A0A067JLI5_JATCU|nr:hypothetical protein JCGZ_25713 [Jatropha curcas]